MLESKTVSDIRPACFFYTTASDVSKIRFRRRMHHTVVQPAVRVR